MIKLIRKTLDSLGLSLFRNKALPIGADYRKTIRRHFGEDSMRLVFDVGANVGQFCGDFCEIFRPQQIYCFEPVPDTFARLQKNTRGKDHVLCLNLALGDEIKTEKMFLRENSVFNSLNPRVNVSIAEDQPSTEVAVTTLDVFCAEKNIDRIDLLKVDTEGFDLNVLKGATRMLKSGKIPLIFIEVTFDAGNQQICTYQTISDYLEKFNYRIHGFYHQHIHRGHTRMNFCNALFALQNNMG